MTNRFGSSLCCIISQFLFIALIVILSTGLPFGRLTTMNLDLLFE